MSTSIKCGPGQSQPGPDLNLGSSTLVVSFPSILVVVLFTTLPRVFLRHVLRIAPLLFSGPFARLSGMLPLVFLHIISH
jgi:hypothetical protein